MLKTFKSKLGDLWFNIRSFKTNRKIIVIESDDWGSTRMPDQKTYRNLCGKNLGVENSFFDTLDSLEKREDLEKLFNLLGNHQNKNGYPKFTFNTIMGNPDFESIKANDFDTFVHEHFFDSYRYYYSESLEDHWFDAINDGLIKPQFHAKAHVNVPMWLRDLKRGNPDTSEAFKHYFYGLKTNKGSTFRNHYLAAQYADNLSDFEAVKENLKDGLNIFKETFGFYSKSFIACNYVWPKVLENELKKWGVDYLQGQRGHIAPQISQRGKKVYRHYTGERNKNKQIYTVRNVTFEPYQNQEKDWVDIALSQIKQAFLWKQPAIISSHRINYVSNMNISNRDKSLQKLSQLLRAINKNWPDVEFLSLDELGDLIIQS